MLSAEEERGRVVRRLATGGERVSMLKRVRGPKITKNSWKSAYIKERVLKRKRERALEGPKEGDRSNEVDSLFSMFAAISVGYRAVAFFSFRSLHEEANFSPALVLLSFSFSFSLARSHARHNEAFMS